MAKSSNKDWRLPPNIKAFIIVLLRLGMWIIAGMYVLGSLAVVFVGGGAFSFIPIIFAVIIAIVGSIIIGLVKEYL